MLDIEYLNDAGISNSDLSLLKESPWMFRQVKDKKVKRVTADHFELGSLIHLAVLQPELFCVSKISKPSGLLGSFLDAYVEAGQTNEAAKYAYEKSKYRLPLKTVLKKLEEDDIQEYLDFIKNNNGKIAITKQQKYIIDNAKRGIERNSIAYELLYQQNNNITEYNEFSLIGVYNGIRLKGQPDRIIIDHDAKRIILIDLKSSSSSPYFRFKRVHNTGDLTIDYVGTGFFGSFKGYSYYRQAAFYKTLIAENFKSYFDLYEFISYIIAVNTTISFDCSVIKVSNEWLDYGRKEMEEYLNRYIIHEREKEWNFPLLDSQKGMIYL